MEIRSRLEFRRPAKRIQGTNGLVSQATLTTSAGGAQRRLSSATTARFSLRLNLALGEKSAAGRPGCRLFPRVPDDINLESYSGVGFRGTARTPIPCRSRSSGPDSDRQVDARLRQRQRVEIERSARVGPQHVAGRGHVRLLKYFQAKDELGELKLSTDHKLNALVKDVEFGASYTTGYNGMAKGLGVSRQPNGVVTLPLPAGRTTDMSFLGLGRIYAYDPLAAYAAGSGASPRISTAGSLPIASGDRKVAQAYGLVRFDDKLRVCRWGRPRSPGDQYRPKTKGYSANGNVLNPVSDGAKYTDFAPNLDLNYRVTDSTVIRFSLARQLARPRLYDMRDSRTWGYDSSLSGSTDLSRSP